MEETTHNQEPANTPTRLQARAAGMVALALIFFAGASFTWVFLSQATPAAPVTVAAAAQITPEPPEPAPPVFEDVELEAEGAIVVDLTTGHTLYELNAEAPLPLASLTKVPLVLVVIEVLSPQTIITIPYDTTHYGTNQKMRAGERWRIQDIIDFTLAISSNRGADILAAAAEEPIREHFFSAPAEEAAVWRMNQMAQNLDLTHTYFLNATGLDESDTQAGGYGSARDMSVLFGYAASSSPSTFEATTKSSFKLRSIDGAVATAINTDEALPAIPGIIMGKTGYTDLAGGNLAVVFEAGGHRISAVVLGSTQHGRFEDMKKLVALTTDAFSSEE